MKASLLGVVFALAASVALAQPQRDRGEGVRGPSKAGPEDVRRDANRGERRELRRPERMRPEEREKLRRDIDEANRNMERRR